MTMPLLLLAIFAVTLGAVAIDWGSAVPIDYRGFAYWMTEGHEKFHIVPWLTVASLALAVAGVAIGWHVYGRREYAEQAHHAIASRFTAIHRILLNKYYMDDLYQWMIDRIALAFSRFVALFDRAVVNDYGVDGAGLSMKTGRLVAAPYADGPPVQLRRGDGGGRVVLVLAWWVLLG